MAQNVIGLDIGSHSVKAVTVKVSMRGSEIIAFDSEPVKLDENGNSLEQSVFNAANRLMMRLRFKNVPVYCALPGENISLRTVKLPPSASRRIEQVLKFELDDVLPYDIEDAVFDYVELGRTSEEISLLTSAVQTSKIERLVKGLKDKNIDPNEVGVAPLSYGCCLSDSKEITAIVDIGHTRTNVAIVGDTVTTSRTILRGGRNFTCALAKEGKVSFEEAEVHKKREGLNGKVGEVLKKAMAPLVREISQTLKGHLAAGGNRVKTIKICGGGALLLGLTEFLKNQLGLMVSVYEPPVKKTTDSGAVLLQGAGSSEIPAKSAAGSLAPQQYTLAYMLSKREETPRAKRFNLRKGDLAFTGDYEYVKKRAIIAAVGLFLVLLAWIFSSVTRYKVMDDEYETLSTRLKAETKRVLGVEVTDKGLIEKQMGGKENASAPMPQTDAFGIVIELSRLIPVSVVHDIELLDIKPKKIKIKGLVSKAEIDVNDPDAEEIDLSPTDLIKQELAKFEECFVSFRIPKVQNVQDRQKYEMDIESKCP